MREAILDAARHLFIAGGYANVPVRRVAAELRCSPAALYRYFKTKNDIFNALAEEGFRLLVSRETLPAPPVDAAPLERLRHFFWGVYEFAKLYPEYFYLIFLDRSAPRLSVESDGLRVVGQNYVHVAKLLEDCVASGDIDRGLDPFDVYNVIVTSVHGIASLYVCDRVPPGADTDAIARGVLDLAIGGLKGGALSGVTTRQPPPRRQVKRGALSRVVSITRRQTGGRRGTTASRGSRR